MRLRGAAAVVRTARRAATSCEQHEQQTGRRRVRGAVVIHYCINVGRAVRFLPWPARIEKCVNKMHVAAGRSLNAARLAVLERKNVSLEHTGGAPVERASI